MVLGPAADRSQLESGERGLYRVRRGFEERAARRALRDFCEDAGFDYFAYVHLRGQESFAVSNYPREWQELYVKRNYLRIDPVVTRAKHAPPIFTW